MTGRILLALVSAMALSHAACGAGGDNTTTKHGDNMKIRLRIGNSALTATLIDSRAAKDFVALLPLTLTLNDLFGREKFAHLPRAISTEGKRTHIYEVGDIAYWSPGPDVAIYYQHDGEEVTTIESLANGEQEHRVEAVNVEVGR